MHHIFFYIIILYNYFSSPELNARPSVLYVIISYTRHPSGSSERGNRQEGPRRARRGPGGARRGQEGARRGQELNIVYRGTRTAGLMLLNTSTVVSIICCIGSSSKRCERLIRR